MVPSALGMGTQQVRGERCLLAKGRYDRDILARPAFAVITWLANLVGASMLEGASTASKHGNLDQDRATGKKGRAYGARPRDSRTL